MKQRGNVLVSVLIGVLAASMLGLTTDQILQNVYQSANTSLRTTLVSGGSSGTVTSTGTAPDMAVFTSATNIGNYAGTGACGAGTFVTALSAAGVATCSAASSLTLAGASGDIQYNNGSSNLGAEAAFNYDFTNNRLDATSMTAATDGTDPMVMMSGTLPAVPSAVVFGTQTRITSAGSASQIQAAGQYILLAGYTGSSETAGIHGQSSAAGTGNTPNFITNTNPVGNFGGEFDATGAGGGFNAGAVGVASSSAGTNAGFYGKATSIVAGNNIGVMGSAGQSTEATGLINVGGYFTLGSALIVSNISTALIADSGAAASPSFTAYDGGVAAFSVIDNASTVVNGLSVVGGATTVGPTIVPIGETNVPLTQSSKGSGTHLINTTGDGVVRIVTGGTGGEIRLGINGGNFLVMRQTAPPTLGQTATGQFGWAAADPSGAVLDAFWTRETVATIQQGADAATATAQIYKSADSTGSTIAGSALTIAAGNGTSGIANGGKLSLNGGAANSSGTPGVVEINGQVYRKNKAGTTTVGGSCGTSPSLAGSDGAGKVTTGTVAPTSCTITFANTWTTAPACVAINETTANLVKATSTTTTLVLVGTYVASDVLAYTCTGY